MHWAALFPTTQIATLLLFTDVIYANLTDEFSSSWGCIIFLFGKNDPSCPTALSSTETKQVVQSTLAAEANTLSDALDAAYFMHQLYAETFLTRESKIYTFFW